MAKRKLERFAQLKQFANVIESVIENNTVPNHTIKGNWRKTYFKNNHPIIVELGCGKGEYTVGLAQRYPEKNFIGIDIKGNRMWVGAKDALDQQLKNVAFIRTRIDFVSSFFAQNEIDEIWLTFSDPQPGKENKRLSSPRFIERYKEILKPRGLVHLKTDSDLLFEYTCAQIQQKKYPLLHCTNDLYRENMGEMDSAMQEILSIKTHYEQLFSAKGFRIKYCKFLIH
jgi:tRNA (guanine-N7-)-methyltransferase